LISRPKVARLEKSTKNDSKFDHAPISQYLRCPRPLILEVLVGSKLVIVVASMNCLLPPIENSSTCQVTQGKRLTIQTSIVFVGEHNYE
jgi:hypothetical protein